MRTYRFTEPFARPLATRPGEFRPHSAPGETLGPELSPGFGNFVMTGTTPPTQDANGIYFNGTTNSATAGKTVAALEDDATYRVVLTIANYVGGQVDLQVYGNTTGHLATSAVFNANGTYEFDLVTDAGVGSLADVMRFRSTGATGTNDFDITFFSIKKVL